MSEIQEIVEQAIENVDPKSGYRLSKIMKVSQATVSEWKSGKIKPKAENLLKLMKLAKQKGTALVLTMALIFALTCFAVAVVAHRGLNIM